MLGQPGVLPQQGGVPMPNGMPSPQIQVMVPGGFPPGSTFPAQYGGQLFNVTVPPGVVKNTLLTVQVPVQVPVSFGVVEEVGSHNPKQPRCC